MNLTDRDRSALNDLVVSLCCCIVLEVVLLVFARTTLLEIKNFIVYSL